MGVLIKRSLRTETSSLSLPDRWSPPTVTTRWKLLTRVFDLHTHRRQMSVIQLGGKQAGGWNHVVEKVSVLPAAKTTKKKNKRSSWLPDPVKRWPIQGW